MAGLVRAIHVFPLERIAHPVAPTAISCYILDMLTIETECEADGRWLADVSALPGAMSYGDTDQQARAKVTALALRIVAERIENGEPLPIELSGMFAHA